MLKRLRLAPRVFIATSSLLIGTVLVTSVTLLYQTSSALRVEAERYAVQLADLLAADFADKGEISLANVMRTINATLNGPMEGQGHIAAQLVAAAADAGYDTTYVVEILTSITEETILDEFWITDTEGFSYLTNIRFPDGPNAGELIPFKFSPDPAEQPQASKFYPLLTAPLDSAAVITQPAQVREIDNKVYKYVGVSGVDQPRIVQVGNELVFTDQEILSNQYATERTDVSAIIEGILGQNLLVEATMLDHLVDALEASQRSPAGIDSVLSRIVEVSHVGEIRIASSNGTELYYSSLPEDDALRTGLAHAESLEPVLDGTEFALEHATALHANGAERYKYATLTRPRSDRVVQVGIPIESSSGNLLYAVYQEEADVTVQNGLPRGLWIFNQSQELAAFARYAGETDESSMLSRDLPANADSLLRVAMAEERVVSTARLALRSPSDRGVWAASPIINTGQIAIGGLAFFLNLDAIADTVKAEAQRTALIALFLLSLTAMATFFGARLLTAPIEVIADAAREVESGEQPDESLVRPVSTRSDEIGSLARVFLDMSAQVFNREEELETLVSQRTQELQSTNHELRRAQEAINQDLEMAKIVQAALIREGTVKNQAFTACARMTPAQRVGGDFVDFMQPSNGKIFISIGDVSGKGVAAALFMAASQAAIKFAMAEQNASLSMIAGAANDRLCNQNPLGLFVTTFLGMVNLNTGVIEYVSAGHEPPYILSCDGSRRLLKSTGGLAMGLIKDYSYSSGFTVLEPGETLFTYTDGLTDMVNTDGEIYGRSRLEHAINAAGASHPEEIIDLVWTNIDGFSVGAPAADDMTCLVLQRRKGNHAHV